MNVNSTGGGMSYMQRMQGTQSAQQNAAVGGLNARQQADNTVAQKMLPLQAAEVAGRAATEAKGMFVDTYA